MRVLRQKLPNQRERMIALRSARSRMTQIMAKIRHQTTLNRRIPSSIDLNIKIGDLALIYRNDGNIWMGSWRVIDTDTKNTYIDCDGYFVEMLMDRCKRIELQMKCKVS